MHINHSVFTNANNLIMTDVDKGRNEAAYFEFYKEMATTVCIYVRDKVLPLSEIPFLVEFARLWRCFS